MPSNDSRKPLSDVLSQAELLDYNQHLYDWLRADGEGAQYSSHGVRVKKVSGHPMYVDYAYDIDGPADGVEVAILGLMRDFAPEGYGTRVTYMAYRDDGSASARVTRRYSCD